MSIIRTDPVLRKAAIACAIIFGTFLAWAVLAPLAEGITAFGKVAGDSDRQVVQHLEGGIIDEILVAEGAQVKAGDPLLILRDVPATSGRDQVAVEQADASASIARLKALSGQASTFDLSGIDFSKVGAAEKVDIERRHRDLFLQQQRKLSADLNVLKSRRSGLAATVQNRRVEIDGMSRQLAIVRSDLDGKRRLLAERLIARNEVTGLERDEARLSAEIGGLVTARAADSSQVNELSRQINQIQAEFDQTVAQELVEEFARKSELEQKRIAVDDRVKRTVIQAPMTGAVLNLRYQTAGGVVQAGQPILEIVPAGEKLIATIEISPSDIENVYKGQKVKTRLAGTASWRTPSLEGEITRVSADLKTDPNGEYSFYEARIQVNAAQRDKVDSAIIPGMPVEAFIESGRKRTLLDYLFEPINATIRRAARQ